MTEFHSARDLTLGALDVCLMDVERSVVERDQACAPSRTSLYPHLYATFVLTFAVLGFPCLLIVVMLVTRCRV